MAKENKVFSAFPKPIKLSALIQAPLSDVWQAWTTEDGARTFFAPECRIEYRVGGAYEMYFDLNAPAGQRGGEGCQILALEELSLLSFTWNAPPEFPSVRFQRTHVMVYFTSMEKNQTGITLIHDGWGKGEDWQKTREYFVHAWGKVVIPRLKTRFTSGPILWN